MDSLEHSAKGTAWKNHKYIRIENGRYIYSEGKGKKDRAATIDEIREFLKGIKLTRGGSGKSSSSKSSGSKGSGSSKEKASTEKKSKDETEKKLKEKEQQPKITVDEKYTKKLEDLNAKSEKRSQLDKVYDYAEKEEAKKKKLKHSDELVFSSEWDKPNLDNRAEAIIHSRKGTTWKKHKYVRKVDGRYIYKTDSGKKKKDITDIGINDDDEFYEATTTIGGWLRKVTGYEGSKLQEFLQTPISETFKKKKAYAKEKD